ncbi:MAG TPA: ferritin-like domain-containing protein [Terracidiphilus sp.]|nr:ferritin-like domain-containing protein [Terracidiphilus sp.]
MPDKKPDRKQDDQRKQQIKELIDALNEDLAREYQAIIAYTIYSNVLKGAQWMSIAAELQKHAAQELQHAMTIADQIDYLGGMPTNTPKPVKLSDKPEQMIRFDLDNETETIKNYRQRVKQAEAVGHYALAESLRTIISQEQEHQHDLATALGIDVPDVFFEGA